jgi:hypothetical protein
MRSLMPSRIQISVPGDETSPAEVYDVAWETVVERLAQRLTAMVGVAYDGVRADAERLLAELLAP